jgi:hypothetical protein
MYNFDLNGFTEWRLGTLEFPSMPDLGHLPALWRSGEVFREAGHELKGGGYGSGHGSRPMKSHMTGDEHP